MDYLLDDSREDKLIEDYLFSGYKPASKSTFDLDQQFAKPIQDEDLFGVAGQDEPLLDEDVMDKDLDSFDKEPEQLDFAKDSFADITSEILCDKDTNSPGSIFEGDELLEPTPVNDTDQQDNPPSELDGIFPDDYSVSSSDDIRPVPINNENACPNKSYSRQKSPPPPSPAQIKMKRMKEQLLEQAKAMSIERPRKLGVGFGDDGLIQVELGTHQLKSDTNSKFIFNRLFNKSKKADSPENYKKSWALQKSALLKGICTKKRKIWDSFQRPTDAYDEEEELVETPNDETSKKDDNSDQEQNSEPEDLDPEEDDGDFEDLEREDQAVSDEEDEHGDEDHNSCAEGENQLDRDGIEEEHESVSNKESDNEEVDELDFIDDDDDDEDDIDDGIMDAEDLNEVGQNNQSPDENDKLDRSGCEDASESEEEASGDYSLDLDDENSLDRIEHKRRAIFIDDEASEDD